MRRPEGDVDLPATQQAIQKMNVNHEFWGWKYPSDVFHIETVTALLRHPGFIVVTRDLTEIALSSLARQDVPFEISLREAAHVARYISERMRFWPWPILVVPFAAALQQPNALVEILCAFLQIDPDKKKREQAADFVQPLTRGYRPYDAKPDQLHDFSSPAENLTDSQILAADLSVRYSKEYLHHFEGLLPKAKAATDRLAAKIESAHALRMASEIVNELGDLFGTCGIAEPGINDTGPRKPDFISADEWRAAVNQLLDRLTVVAQEASQDAVRSTTNYDAVNRIHRALQLLIRVLTVLVAGVHRIGVEKI